MKGLTCRLSLVVLWLAAKCWGYFPVCEERFVSTNDSYKVSTFEKLVDTAESSNTLGSGKQSVTAASSSSPYNATNQNNNTLGVSLKPGVSMLQTDSSGLAYFVNVTVGNDVFPLLIDTGSAYLWVYGSDCNASACSGKELFSTSFVEKEQSTFALQYSSGVASGDVYEDRIIVNKLATTENFTFGVADEVPSTFANYPISGVFGLPSNNSENIQSIISALRDSNAISIEKFSIYLGNLNTSNFTDSSSTEYQTAMVNKGIFAIGNEINELYTGELYYNKLLSNENHYWSLGINNIYIDSYAVNFTNYENYTGTHSHTKRSSIVDSGTTLLILPKQDALDVHSFFESSVTDGTNFAILCNSTQNITFDFGSKNWTLSPSSYLGSAYPESSIYDGYCVSNIQGLEINEAWILGNVFLENVYSVFDVENQKLGFAEKNSNAVIMPYSDSASVSTASGTQPTSEIATTTSSSRSSSSSSSRSTSSGLAADLRPGGITLGLSMVLSFFL